MVANAVFYRRLPACILAAFGGESFCLSEGGIAFELCSFANSFIFNGTVSGQLGIAAEFWWNWIVLRVAQWAASAQFPRKQRVCQTIKILAKLFAYLDAKFFAPANILGDNICA